MKSNYMTRLERWARWMLPRQEAEDVLSDYRDIVADPELAQDLGKPRAVIWALADRKSYYTWLGVIRRSGRSSLGGGAGLQPADPLLVRLSLV